MYKILVADDNKDLLETIMKTLTDESFKVFLAPNGKLACEIALLKQPDLIVMDWVMPQMNGIDAVVQLKANEETKHIPIIMLTSQSKPEDLKLAMGYGVTDYIKKPFNTIELIARIKTNIKLIESYKEIAQLKVKSLVDANELEKMRNRELTNEVKSKTKTLQATALNLAQKNELLDKVMKQLTNVLKGESISFLKIENLLRDLNHTRESDTSLKNFSEELSKLNYKMIEHLKRLYPHLGETELKVCSMISLGLTNKEIADLLFLSIRTVESHRYHIGKKIEIEKGSSLKRKLQGLEKQL